MSETPSNSAVFIGVHLASERVHVSAVTEQGDILVQTSAPFNLTKNNDVAKGRCELNPEVWWDATRLALGHLVSQLRTKVSSPSQLQAISVCCNPGAILTIDKNGSPLLPAILQEDQRAVDFVKSLNYHGQEHCERLGVRFTAESPLAKIAWIKDSFPELYEEARFIHQADFILGRLKGTADVTEYSTALLTGCDVLDECWPDWLDYDMHLSIRERLPQLCPIGTKVGTICSKASSVTGLPTGMTVVMGTTAHTASFLASGARNPGDSHTVLDDTLSFNGISTRMVRDPHSQMRVYKLPGHAWFYSVESRTGAEWVKGWFSDGSFEDLEKESHHLLPTNYLAYPNVRKGETFPFHSSSAEGFISPATDNRTVQFASCLQGTAMFERYCYQKLDKLANVKDNPGDVYSGGEWGTSDAWMQCRADVTGRINRRMIGHGGAAFGAAMMAALGSFYTNLEQTAEAMIKVEAVFFPNPELLSQYTELYGNFCELMAEQGYC